MQSRSLNYLLFIGLSIGLIAPEVGATPRMNHDGNTYINLLEHTIAARTKNDCTKTGRTKEAAADKDQTENTWKAATKCQKAKTTALEKLSDQNASNVRTVMAAIRNCYCDPALMKLKDRDKDQLCTVNCAQTNSCQCKAHAFASQPNKKKNGNIVMKANRPGIITTNAWHDIEHIRDALRFKTVMANLEDVPKLVELVRDTKCGDQTCVKHILKIDVDKLFEPKKDHIFGSKSWGWRIIAFDLLMQNGQIVEWYLPVAELEMQKKHGGSADVEIHDAKAKLVLGGGHLLFEAFRNMTLAAQKKEKVHIAIETKCPTDGPEIENGSWTLPFALAMVEHGCTNCTAAVKNAATKASKDFYAKNEIILTRKGSQAKTCKIAADFGKLSYEETLDLSSALYNHAFTLGLLRMGYGPDAVLSKKEKGTVLELTKEVLKDKLVDASEYAVLQDRGQRATAESKADWEKIKEAIKTAARTPSGGGPLKAFTQDKGTECDPAVCGGEVLAAKKGT